jgi:FkbM family methyltransferase
MHLPTGWQLAISKGDLMTRTFTVSKFEFADCSFLMESMIYPWGRDDQVVEHIHAGTFDELESLRLWMFAVSTAPQNYLALDVGAYSGLYSLLAVASRPDIKSVALEPGTITYGRLARNVSWNSMEVRILAANLAASNISGPVTLPHAYGIFSMNSGDGLNQSIVDHTEGATAVRLDELLESQLPHFLNTKATPVHPFNGIAAIKIDVEGLETSVLRGGLNMIRRYRPVILCEYWDKDAEKAISDVMASEDYVLAGVKDERNLIAIPKERYTKWDAGYKAWKMKHADSLDIRMEIILNFCPN